MYKLGWASEPDLNSGYGPLGSGERPDFRIMQTFRLSSVRNLTENSQGFLGDFSVILADLEIM